MNPLHAFSLKRLVDIGVETYWSSGLRSAPRPTPTWELDPDQLSQVCIEWPATYHWKPFRRWLEPLVEGFSRYVKVIRTETPQGRGIIVPRFVYRGAPSYVVIDQSDYLDFVNEDWVNRSIVYFKMQYDALGYSIDKIVPGGFIPHSGDIYRYLPYIRPKRNASSYGCDVYSRFSLEFEENIRRKFHSRLLGNSFTYVGGPSKVRYSRFLREAARSKICIDVPGNADVCCRLIDYLAIGTCVIGLKPRTVFHVPLVNGKHVIFAKPDLSDLTSLCGYYLDNDQKREEIASNARDFFDQYLHRDQIAAYYLKVFLERVT